MFLFEEETKNEINKFIDRVDRLAFGHRLFAYTEEEEKVSSLVKDVLTDHGKFTFEEAGSIYDRAEEVIDALAHTDDCVIKLSSYYADASKLCSDNKHWHRCRAFLGDKCEKTDSDRGCLKIGNGESFFYIPNGYGDGTTRYAILRENEPLNEFMFDFFCSIQGRFSIYNYDCDDFSKPIDEINGEYAIFSHDGMIVFKKKD